MSDSIASRKDNIMVTSLKHTLFTDVSSYYQDLIAALEQAEHSIYMIFFAFDQGEWEQRISHILRQKAANQVAVHLMVDELGTYVDNFRNGWRNRALLADLRSAGVQVDVFRPRGPRLSQFNRLHVKMCTIDHTVLFVGGSNIGDHYPSWRDTNLRLDGDLGNTFIQLYRYLYQFSQAGPNGNVAPFCSRLPGISLPVTLPGYRQDIRQALLDLILNAEDEVYIRSWYFLPDFEILDALLSQAKNGVRITVLFSHQTRVPFIDAVNKIIGRKLARAGVRVYRYRGRYMHAKEAWNDKGDILLGSANVDPWALYSNFECSLQFCHRTLAQELQQALLADLCHCRQQRATSWHHWMAA